MFTTTAIYWLRQDLRLSDNPALINAASKANVLPIYIFDDINAKEYSMGAASKIWLHHSLLSLNKSLENNLSLYKGNPLEIILKLCKEYKITQIFWNRCYEPWQIKRDSDIKKALQEKGIEVNSFNASLLWEPWQVTKDDGGNYKIFTPFYKNSRFKSEKPREPILSAQQNITFFKDTKFNLNLEQLKLLPNNSWHIDLAKNFVISEQAAQNCLDKFITNGLNNYKEGRNFPASNNVSRLSPYLHFGQISPHQIWDRLSLLENNINIEHFRQELCWREFSYHLIYHNPNLDSENLNTKFNNFPWTENNDHLLAWQKGETGIPIVDAGMRELWQTGYMHNRIRMIVASFLVKNLLIHWRYGANFFWDCLFDADLANNSASWQWVAGCGTDAAPYFRIFNPVLQAQRFDPNGEYIKKYVPELTKLPVKYIFNPSETPPLVLSAAGVKLGLNYPYPIVDLEISRKKALSAYAKIK